VGEAGKNQKDRAREVPEDSAGEVARYGETAKKIPQKSFLRVFNAEPL